MDPESRARQAQRLLDDPLLKEAFEAAEAEYIKQWRSSPVRDTEGREHLYVMLRSLERVKGHLESLAATGKLIDAQREQQKEQSRLKSLMSRFQP